ncbi:MAG: BlaI/MecI/CopY family transcriptional regulator [Bdellovibrionaceae bacterium]|nr:BlaI/MecI/CopY family transcriptional regulator [Pseudobdellovibrionaceae bacterium]
MVQRKRLKLEKLLTEVELELMNVIWNLKECTVKDVQEALPKSRDLAYTSVATVMKILEQKGALKSEKKERAHTYQALVSRSEYETMGLQHLKTNVFGGDPTSMVMRLLNEPSISPAEMESIRSLIEERLKE